MDYLKECDDNAFQLAICDPPYFEGPNNSGYYGKEYSNSGVERAKYKECKEWDIPDEEYFNELVRVSKNQIIWGANHFAGVFNSSSPSWIVWDKDNDKSTFADCELAYTSFKTAVKKYTFTWNGMLQGDMKNKEKRIHPTQKPVKLYEWLLTNYAKEGDRILDTHGGSMSSAIACHNLNHDMTIIELDEDYFKAGKERLEAHQQQLRFNM